MMAQPIACDICGEETAVQMLSNLETGGTMALGPACAVGFYGQLLSETLGIGPHDKPAGKCQACRRLHERVTTPDKPAVADVADAIPGDTPETPAEVPEGAS